MAQITDLEGYGQSSKNNYIGQGKNTRASHTPSLSKKGAVSSEKMQVQ